MIVNSRGVGRLLQWTYAPEPNDAIHSILRDLTNDDLLFAFTHFDGPIGRIAWAEYGRRKKFIDFEVKVVTMEGQLNLSFEGDAKAIHENPILDVEFEP